MSVQTTTFLALDKKKEPPSGSSERQKICFPVDLGRDRTCNLLIRSQTPCHWATRPFAIVISFLSHYAHEETRTELGRATNAKLCLGYKAYRHAPVPTPSTKDPHRLQSMICRSMVTYGLSCPAWLISMCIPCWSHLQVKPPLPYKRLVTLPLPPSSNTSQAPATGTPLYSSYRTSSTP